MVVNSYLAAFYVAPSGNDSNPGTFAQPWRTIQKAANTLVAGQTVKILPGTYNAKLAPVNSGTAGAYITYIADLHGIEYSGEAGIEFPKKGIKTLGLKSLPPDIKDLSPVIKEAKASNADVFCCFAYPDQLLPAVATSMELAFNPKVWIGGPGVNFGFFHTAFKGAVEGVTGWSTYSPKQSAAAKALADKLYTGKPEDIQDWWGHPYYWAGLEMWKQAIEKAGTLDQKKIRDIIATQHFTTILGDTWFTNGLLAKEAHPGEVGQWQNGVYEVVGGRQTTAEFVYPKPAWPAPAK
jgi:hypothetical protein